MAYDLFAKQGRRHGFVTNVGDMAIKGKTSSEGDIRALRQYDNVAIRFDEPIIALTEHYAVL